MLVLLALLAVATIGGFATLYVLDRNGKCKDCKEPVWCNVVDCSPAGPNPLRVRCRQKNYHCKKCGTLGSDYTD